MESTGFIRNIARANLAACENADSFLQSAMWGTFKSRFGWRACAFLIDWAGFGGCPLLVLSRRVACGISISYIPWGPELPAGFPADDGLRVQVLAELARKLRPFLPWDTVFARFDLPWVTLNEAQAAVLPFKRAAADIQPPDTVLIDLSASAGDIIAAMKPKWRYNISLSEKRGVTVNRPNEEGIEIFYRLLEETADRDGIAIHRIDYYRTLFEICRLAGAELCLYTACHEGDTLAAIVVLCRGRQATYLYGASANIKRNLMAPYALQWQAMQDAKAFGCVLYDLFGIPPAEDPGHPMAGLYRFKTGFGGTIIHRPGSWDYPYKPLLYGLFSAAEGRRKKNRDRKKR